MNIRRVTGVLTTVVLLCSSVSAYGATTKPLPSLKVAKVVRIGFFANVTHAPALVGQAEGFFVDRLKRDGTTVQFVAFNAGPAAIEAMKGRAIDMTFIGPNPTINGFVTTRSALLRIVSGSTSGGAQLVVRNNINSISELKGKKLASPQLGNTQDVALRAWLKSQGLTSSITGGGDVSIIPTENAQTLTLFKRGDIDGAWLPEPWASRLVLEANAKVFLDEKTLWENGDFVTTHVITSTQFLRDYPGTVRTVIQANRDSIAFIKEKPSQAQNDVQTQIQKYTGKPLSDAVLARAWGNLTFTEDPLVATLIKSAADAVAAGLLTVNQSRGLQGIYDLRMLNQLRKSDGLTRIATQGLGLQ